ncbi:MAG: DUF367 family protein [Conexivisphaerales archaeon]
MENADNRQIRLHVIHLGQDDPSKCTAMRLKRAGVVDFSYNERRGILLDPFSPRALSRTDKETVAKEGIVAVDASWKVLERDFMRIKWNNSKRRSLPLLIAANPTNYGRPYNLSTAEALASSLYITGYAEQAREIMAHFKWGDTFFALNTRYLELYSMAKDSHEIISLQSKIINSKL